MNRNQVKDNDIDVNADPNTGAPGAHPVGTGAGAVGGGIAGAAIGAAAGGPVGGAVGAAVGGIVGGLAGKGVAETINPTVEHEYWRREYLNRPYWSEEFGYDDYGPAYEYGWVTYSQYAPQRKTFDEVEPQLEQNWNAFKNKSKLTWREAKEAVRDAWLRYASRP
jgi:hypothetical protein